MGSLRDERSQGHGASIFRAADHPDAGKRRDAGKHRHGAGGRAQAISLMGKTNSKKNLKRNGSPQDDFRPHLYLTVLLIHHTTKPMSGPALADGPPAAWWRVASLHLRSWVVAAPRPCACVQSQTVLGRVQPTRHREVWWQLVEPPQCRIQDPWERGSPSGRGLAAPL